MTGKILKNLRNQSPEARALVQKAYKFAKKAHEGQMRKSGDPFFTHVEITAERLAEIGVDENGVAAGLMHDVIEDTSVTPEELEKEFGEEVLFLVDGVTRLGSIKYRGSKTHVESLRRLFVATAQDVRVILIKLYDRLHNMETLEFQDPARQKRKATETLEIYAPIAERLGMGKLKTTLEDLSFKYTNTEKYEETARLRKSQKSEKQAVIDKAHKSIKRALADNGIRDFQTTLRIKGIYSLHKKLQRRINIENIHDIAAIRVIVPSVDDCYKVLGIVHNMWRPLPGRIKDYIACEKPNGYQSLHTTVFTGDGGIVEIQIRTNDMHQRAEYGIASHSSYKEKGSEQEADQTWIRSIIPSLLNFRRGGKSTSNVEADTSTSSPQWMKELAEAHEAHGDKDFMKDLKNDFFNYRIFAFTPKGDVIDLPVGSSPIDFAYAIHTDIGNRMTSVKVNGKMVTLKTKLKNGDIVEVITKNSAKPSQKWLEHVRTTLARRKISAAVHKQAKEY